MTTRYFSIYSKIVFATITLTFAGRMAIAQPSSCGVPPPPPPTATHGTGGDKAPGGAPVGTADILLVTLAALYGAYRLYQSRRPEEA